MDEIDPVTGRLQGSSYPVFFLKQMVQACNGTGPFKPEVRSAPIEKTGSPVSKREKAKTFFSWTVRLVVFFALILNANLMFWYGVGTFQESWHGENSFLIANAAVTLGLIQALASTKVIHPSYWLRPLDWMAQRFDSIAQPNT